MLEISKIRANKENFKIALQKRGWETEKLAMLEEVISADDARKRIQTENDGYLAQRNNLSKQIGQLFKEGKTEEANAAKAEVDKLKSLISEAEQQLNESKQLLEELLLNIPNIPHESVPNGNSEEDNEVVKHGVDSNTGIE